MNTDHSTPVVTDQSAGELATQAEAERLLQSKPTPGIDRA
jgi:hypothetical protein